MSYITLHPEKGVNPKLTTCWRCGADVGVALPGAKDSIYTCTHGVRSYGGPPGRNPHQKMDCGCTSGQYKFDRKMHDHEKIPIEQCDDCTKEITEQGEVVKAGGIYFKCVDCGASGAIRAQNPLCTAVREQLKTPAPAPCGIEFNKETCPACGPKPEAS